MMEKNKGNGEPPRERSPAVLPQIKRFLVTGGIAFFVDLGFYSLLLNKWGYFYASPVWEPYSAVLLSIKAKCWWIQAFSVLLGSDQGNYLTFWVNDD